MRAGIKDVRLDELRDGLASGTLTLVDVREPHEFAAGHIPGSMSHPLSTFDPEVIRKLHGRVVFSCAAGVRSLKAIEWAQAAGLPLTEHYAGGFKEWLMSGGPVAYGAD